MTIDEADMTRVEHDPSARVASDQSDLRVPPDDLRVPPDRLDFSGLRGKQILYVDDDRLLRQAVKRLLRRAGAGCMLAGTHAQAVAAASVAPSLTLAILDFHMPDGYVGHLVSRLRDANPTLALIGTSGADRRTEFARHGVTQFLEKPWQIVDLVGAVERACAATPRLRPEIPTDLWMGARLPRD